MNANKSNIIQYYRENNKPRSGVVVSTDKGIIGWALCSPMDTFSREKALEIAFGRASKAQTLSEEQLQEYYDDIPHSLRHTSQFVMQRADRYFK